MFNFITAQLCENFWQNSSCGSQHRLRLKLILMASWFLVLICWWCFWMARWNSSRPVVMIGLRLKRHYMSVSVRIPVQGNINGPTRVFVTVRPANCCVPWEWCHCQLECSFVDTFGVVNWLPDNSSNKSQSSVHNKLRTYYGCFLCTCPSSVKWQRFNGSKETSNCPSTSNLHWGERERESERGEW